VAQRREQQQPQPQRQPLPYYDAHTTSVPMSRTAFAAPPLLAFGPSNPEPRGPQTVQAIATVGMGSPPGAPPRTGPMTSEDYGYAQPGLVRQNGPPTQTSTPFRANYGGINSPSPSTATEPLIIDGVKVTSTTPWTGKYTVDLVGDGRWDLESTDFGARVSLVSHGVGPVERNPQVEGMIGRTDDVRVYHHVNAKLQPSRSTMTYSGPTGRDVRDGPSAQVKRSAGGELTYQSRPPEVDPLMLVCCPHCRAYGHHGDDCPSEGLCERCGLSGHADKDCPHTKAGQLKR
jgi:hypothetical protein